MKKAAVLGVKHAGLVEAPVPEIPEDSALIKVHFAPMCAEYKGFLDGNISDCLGHEAVGEVVQIPRPGRIKWVTA